MLDAISLDHQMARQYLEEMRQALETLRTGNQAALIKFVAHARKYIEITQYNLEQKRITCCSFWQIAAFPPNRRKNYPTILIPGTLSARKSWRSNTPP